MKACVLVLASVITLFSSINAFACSCGGPESNLATLKSVFERYDDPENNLIVVSGKVVSYDKYAMNIDIGKVVYGKENRTQIKVYGDNGMLCRPYVKNFPIGSEWVWILHPSDDNEGADNYAVSICGIYYLPINNQNNGQISVKGEISSETVEELEFSEYTKLVLNTIDKVLIEKAYISSMTLKCNFYSAIADGYLGFGAQYANIGMSLADANMSSNISGIAPSVTPVWLPEVAALYPYNATLTITKRGPEYGNISLLEFLYKLTLDFGNTHTPYTTEGSFKFNVKDVAHYQFNVMTAAMTAPFLANGMFLQYTSSARCYVEK